MKQFSFELPGTSDDDPLKSQGVPTAFTELVVRVEVEKECVPITRQGKVVAVIISKEGFERYEALMDELELQEDLVDIEEAREEYRQGNYQPWDEVKKELGL